MTELYLFLLILAAGCFVASAFKVNVGRVDRPLNLVALGLFLWTLVPLIQTARSL